MNGELCLHTSIAVSFREWEHWLHHFEIELGDRKVTVFLHSDQSDLTKRVAIALTTERLIKQQLNLWFPR